MLIAIVYFSESGTTHQVAKSICEGVNASRSNSDNTVVCELLRIKAVHIASCRFECDEYLSIIDRADAVIFGSPTYMGGPAAQFKAFADASSDRWEGQQWNNKVAAGFTTGSNAGGDQLCCLQYFSILAAQHGMFWVTLDMQDHSLNEGSNLGMQLGFAAVVPADTISEADRKTAQRLGQRVVDVCSKISDK